MLTVHYTVYRRIDLAEDKTVTSEGFKALSVIKALTNEFGNLESLSLPYYSPELGVIVESVAASDDAKIVVTLKRSEASNE